MTDTIQMRSVEEAQAAILHHFAPLEPETIALSAALGRVVATDIRADIDLPPFDNSSMDGYAVRAADMSMDSNEVTLRVAGAVPAGGVATEPVAPGTAIRIMTGAPVPPGADLVVPIEDTDDRQTDAREGFVRILRAGKPGNNIRPAAADVRRGTVVVPAQTVIMPGAVGVLASVGAAQVAVYRRPKVAILATGDELVEVDQVPGPGQIRNSNGYANAAQVLAAGAEVLQLPIARDTAAAVRAQLEAGRDWGADVFLTSGGVSVGDYDVVKQVLNELGRLEFWRVAMKPGKPLAFGRVLDRPLFGLPGNPVSAMVTFELFGRPALLRMGGHRAVLRRPILATCADRIADADTRRKYFRVRMRQTDDGWIAELTGNQGSGMLSSMLHADGLLVVPETVALVEPGMRLPVLMLGWPESGEWSPTL